MLPGFSKAFHTLIHKFACRNCKTAQQLGNSLSKSNVVWKSGREEFSYWKSKTFFFKGIILRSKIDRSNTAYGELIIEGYSPTILLDWNPHCRYLNDVKLNDIVKKITDEVPMNVKTTIQQQFNNFTLFSFDFPSFNFS